MLLTPDYVSYVQQIKDQRSSNKERPKLSLYVPFSSQFSYSEPVEELVAEVLTQAYQYVGTTRVFSTLYREKKVREVLAYEFINRGRFLYLPVSQITELEEALPFIETYTPESNYLINYPDNIYLSQATVENFADFYSFELTEELSHPFLPGFLFTNRAVTLPTSGVILYEYKDQLGNYGPQYETYLSPLRPFGWDSPLGAYSELQLKDTLRSLIGSYSHTGSKELIGKYTGKSTNFTYHPSVIYYQYQREDGSYFLSEHSPSLNSTYAENFLIRSGLKKEGVLFEAAHSTSSLTMGSTGSNDFIGFYS